MIEEITSREELKSVLYGQEWFEQEFKNCFVDLSKKAERPETIISIGEHTYGKNTYPTPIMTAGEFSAISAPSKSKKSYLKSFLAASYIGGQSNKYFPNIKGHRKADDIIFDCDTEQSRYYSQHTFDRTIKMVGNEYKNYYPFKMRHLTAEQRVAFLDCLLKDKRFKDKVKLVFIDGVADLIDDSNDLVMSNYIAGKLLQWTDLMKIHVCVIIHNAFGTKKPTGHLGSAVVKKAETVMLLSPLDDEKKIIKVENPYSRGVSFDPFFFKIHDSMPYECDEMGRIRGLDEDFTDYKPLPLGDPKDKYNPPF